MSEQLTEAKFCYSLISRKGETAEQVRDLISVSEADKKYLAKTLTRFQVAVAVANREKILREFENLLTNPMPMRVQKKPEKRRAYRRVSEKVEKQILEAMQQPYKVKRLAARFGVSDSVVRRLRDDPRTEPAQSRTKLDRERARQLRREGISVSDIAKRFGVSSMTVRRSEV